MPTQPNESHVYLNGKILPRSQAHLDIEDRAALFADGVYEVIKCFNSHARAMDRHVKRLSSSLASIAIPETDHVKQLPHITMELLKLNNLPNAKVYWQVSRGAGAPRDHLYPVNASPTVLAITYPGPAFVESATPKEVACILHPDERWGRCDIKSLMLLPNVIAKNKAHAAGADEAILHKDGDVTEATSSSVFIVRKGVIVTHPSNSEILPGVTRSLLLEAAQFQGIPISQRHYNIHELLTADEVFLSVTTQNIKSVTTIDGKTIADGKAGPIATKLFQALNALDKQYCHIP
jgi:D-alanine transaminase